MNQVLNLLVKLAIVAVIGYGGYTFYRSYFDNDTDKIGSQALVRQVLTINAEQLKGLLESGPKNNRPALMYIFESTNIVSRFYFADIVKFYDLFPRDKLNIIMLSLDQDPKAIAAFLDKKGFQRLRILRMDPSERQNMVGKIFELGGHFDGGVPYVVVINKSGLIEEVPLSFNRSDKIKHLIERSSEQKT
ncbi:MAG: hypothetical protein EB060_01855 [Proteobacteria bacterium]|nr:hypothetical protein [Pseudomonadota bacterium]